MDKARAIKKRNMALLFAGGAVFGIVVFLLTYGVTPLNVTKDNWITEGGPDLAQHYLGWVFYRDGAWMFPIGLTDRMTYPYSASVIFTDSIPLLAVLFKIISPLLPGTFQYLGLYACGSFALVGGLGAWLGYKVARSYWQGLVIGGLLVLTPALLFRTLQHTALGGHWLILLPLVFWAYGKNWQKYWQRMLFWCGMLVLCVGIHSYFIPMVMCIQAAWAVYIGITEEGAVKRRLLHVGSIFIISALAGVAALWVLGGFEGVNSGDGGLGAYSMNLNGFFNDILGYSRFFSTLPYNSGQYEGYAYLGAGVLLLCAAAAVTAIVVIVRVLRQSGVRAGLRRLVHAVPVWGWCGIALCIVLFVLAVGPAVTLCTEVLFTIPYPGFVISILQIFRCTGRFIWPVLYMLPLTAVWLLRRVGGTRLLATLLLCALALQLADISKGMAKIRAESEERYAAQPMPINPLWEELASEVEHIVLYTGPKAQYTHAYRDIGYFTATHGLTQNNYYLARAHSLAPYTGLAYRDEVLAGNMREDTMLLIAPSAPAFVPFLLEVTSGYYAYQLDEYVAVLPFPLEGGETIDVQAYLAQHFPPESGNPVSSPEGLDVLANYAHVLYESTLLPGGDISIGYAGDMRGQNITLQPGLYMATIQGEGLVAEYCNVNSSSLGKKNDGIDMAVSQHGTTVTILFAINKEVEDLEIWVENPNEEPIIVTGIWVKKQ